MDDVVEAGRERRPLPRGWYAVLGVALAALAVAGTLRTLDRDVAPPAARRSPAPLPSPTGSYAPAPLGNAVAPAGALTAPPLAPGTGLEVTLVAPEWIVSVDTRDDRETTLLDPPATEVVHLYLPLPDGFAALVGPRPDVPSDPPVSLVVHHRGTEQRTELYGYLSLLAGERDGEFWTYRPGGAAQRWDARGRRVGPPVGLPDHLLPLRGVAGGLLVSDGSRDLDGGDGDEDGEPVTALAVWDPHTRRIVRTLAGNAAAGPVSGRYVTWTRPCAADACPTFLTDAVSGRTWPLPKPAIAGTPGAVPSGDGRHVAMLWADTRGYRVFVATPGGSAAREIGGSFPEGTRVTWSDDGRLVIAQVVDGDLVVLVWDPATGRLGQAGVYQVGQITDFSVRPARAR